MICHVHSIRYARTVLSQCFHSAARLSVCLSTSHVRSLCLAAMAVVYTYNPTSTHGVSSINNDSTHISPQTLIRGAPRVFVQFISIAGYCLISSNLAGLHTLSPYGPRTVRSSLPSHERRGSRPVRVCLVACPSHRSCVLRTTATSVKGRWHFAAAPEFFVFITFNYPLGVRAPSAMAQHFLP